MALVTASLSGCATVDPGRPSVPVGHGVPLASPGGSVHDARAAFALLIADALRGHKAAQDEVPTDGVQAAATVDPWLHPVPAPSPADRTLVRQIRQRFAARAGQTAVLIVPGLFGDCVQAQSVPFGDGVLRSPERSTVDAYGGFSDLGLHTLRLVPLPGRATAAHNGERLAALLPAEAAVQGVERLVLVSYSKGTADLLHAIDLMKRSGTLPAALRAVVSVAGVVHGTPLADRFEGLYDTVLPRMPALGCATADGDELAGLTRREREAWWAGHRWPQGVRAYSVVAHALPSETAPLLRPFQHWLARFDARNDGQMLAPDAVLPGSTLLAEVRADHWDVALPRERHPNPIVRGLGSGRGYPREALLRALLWWAIGSET